VQEQTEEDLLAGRQGGLHQKRHPRRLEEPRPDRELWEESPSALSAASFPARACGCNILEGTDFQNPPPLRLAVASRSGANQQLTSLTCACAFFTGHPVVHRTASLSIEQPMTLPFATSALASTLAALFPSTMLAATLDDQTFVSSLCHKLASVFDSK